MNTSQSVRRVREINALKAKILKDMTISNETAVKEEKKKEEQQKREIVL
jgi:hypothetical protein